jgi:aspartyl-tRNA(Asn)/glutamyl-tRNA(Gln) amidotransferase subunit A
MALMAMGSDTGGSIRIPASFCGTVGFKATFERVSREGGHPLGFTLDHMGPLTRTVRDAAVVLDAITEDREASTVPQPGILLDGIRLGVPRNFYLDRIAPAVRRAYDNCVSQAERFGASISEITVPDIEALNAVARVILLAEAASVMHRFRDRRGDIGADVRALHDQGRMISAVDYIDAQRLRRVITRDFGRSVAGVDCFLTPTTPTTAPLIGQATVDFGEGASEDVRLATTRLVRGINVLGWPALSIPCGFDEGHLPIGLQIVGRPFRDDVVLRTGAALEDALGPAPLAV